MMKCEHCGAQEATFYCKSSINGVVKEAHLCPDCAEKLGYTRHLREAFRPMRLFTDPFAAFTPLFGRLGTHLLTEFPSLVEEQTPEQPSPLVDDAEREKLRIQRERNALETQLKAAVEREDYETAARLRDELKALKD